MSNAHRPTFDPARGRSDQAPTRIYASRMLPNHTQLKFRKQGQGSSTELQQKDLKAELLRAEEEAKAKKSGKALPVDDPAPALAIAQSGTEKHALTEGDEEEESPEAKRRRILEESKDLDADDSDEEKDDEDDEHDSDEDSDDDDDEDETAALLAELAKIKAERAAAAQKLASENAAAEDDARVESIALGNPLLNPDSFKVKKRWDEDVIFRNQARGADLDGRGGKKGFVNDLLRSEFHRKFMGKYIH
ncbi:Cwf15/Cwc15 cell cycle control protein [Saitoella complicata NRRL Y-17804]|uniref:Cwf15/Cwc15 cell cycle control protein n=1 Tax=Saitoella complicata (strain BCRC 22490 / CBS 7301 / JCM 7358 / NBRC 10748 / NRRL Y-17804) TaxID=698492 RepID=UPI0008677323|nr:Cwf15/Cwc15 cell cycle control protein [Saitoella complicata NRRL Y-17804]ODQ51486.1 Cwf15/Cwc15 cell cycle control protein [Saitoella complicata NRRL Y-17804]